MSDKSEVCAFVYFLQIGGCVRVLWSNMIISDNALIRWKQEKEWDPFSYQEFLVFNNPW